VNNNTRKSSFIEKTLTKAMNFMGEGGYDLVRTCNYIKKHAVEEIKKDEKDDNQTERLN
jgi:hypothetical protein